LIISFVLAGLFVGSGIISIVLMLYIARTRIREMDKLVHGFEIPNDSIFFIVLRVPNYSLAFMWKLYAKRGGFEGKIEHLDKHFRWPFIAAFLLALLSLVFLMLGILFDNYFDIG